MVYNSALSEAHNVEVSFLARSNYSAISKDGVAVTIRSVPPVSKTIRPHAVYYWDEKTLSGYGGEPFDFV